jgi:hypothetical protein
MQIPRYLHKTQDDKVVQRATSSLLRVVIVLLILSYPALEPEAVDLGMAE